MAFLRFFFKGFFCARRFQLATTTGVREMGKAMLFPKATTIEKAIFISPGKRHAVAEFAA